MGAVINQMNMAESPGGVRYQTSEKAIIETIEANEYSFTADGKIATRINNLAEEEL
jgi:hypothetical protein